MKSHVSVLLDPATKKPMERLREILERHRLDEDDLASIQSHHWDYWGFPMDGKLRDVEVAAHFPEEEEEEFFQHASWVRNLPKDYSTSAIILEDGSWTDLQDFGWGMMREPSQANTEALARWDATAALLFQRYKDHLCIQILTHC